MLGRRSCCKVCAVLMFNRRFVTAGFYISWDVIGMQQRIRSGRRSINGEEEDEMPEIKSTIPFITHPTPKTLKQLYLTHFSFISRIIRGLIAPILEVELNIGGTSYEYFVRSWHLPMQLSPVDPIVASFSGGAVGVISALILIEVEANNVEHQDKIRCRVFCGIFMSSLLLLLGAG